MKDIYLSIYFYLIRSNVLLHHKVDFEWRKIDIKSSLKLALICKSDIFKIVGNTLLFFFFIFFYFYFFFLLLAIKTSKKIFQIIVMFIMLKCWWSLLKILCIYLIPLPWAGNDTRSIFKQTAGLKSVFFLRLYCHNKVKELSLPYHLPIVGGKIDF